MSHQQNILSTLVIAVNLFWDYSKPNTGIEKAILSLVLYAGSNTVSVCYAVSAIIIFSY